MNALILVDIQNDFLPGGALAVSHGDEVIEVANWLRDRFGLVVATQDWHPADHASFASQHSGRSVGDTIELAGRQQTLWPDHCVQETEGARLAANLVTEHIAKVFPKGTDREIDSYSGFFDNDHRRATGLDGFLKERGVSDVYVMGLATDYCVKFTALDAVQLGYRVYLIEDGCLGVNLQGGDVLTALDEMHDAGVVLLTSKQLEPI